MGRTHTSVNPVMVAIERLESERDAAIAERDRLRYDLDSSAMRLGEFATAFASLAYQSCLTCNGAGIYGDAGPGMNRNNREWQVCECVSAKDKRIAELEAALRQKDLYLAEEQALRMSVEEALKRSTGNETDFATKTKGREEGKDEG